MRTQAAVVTPKGREVELHCNYCLTGNPFGLENRPVPLLLREGFKV